MAGKKNTYDVFALDMYLEDGCWTENERHYLGKLSVTPVSGNVDEGDILAAMRAFSFSDLMGRRLRALDTTDRRRVYVEDYTGDGTWWEVGTVKDRMPIYGLRLIDEAA